MPDKNQNRMTQLFSIAKVSAQTGIAKEVLRKWEVRYGFPVPVRDDAGNRVYTESQLNRLRVIRRLMNDGMRPGQIVPLEEAELALLLERQQAQQYDVRTVASSDASHRIVGWLQARDPDLLRENLRAELAALGLGAFVHDLMPTMNMLVGQAWESGAIAVRDEHLYSEVVQGLVRQALAELARPAGRPRVLLTTVPGEAHSLGILMLEAALVLEQADCVSLGPQSPLPEIVAAATDFRADVVGLSFSAAFPRKKIAPLLKELRAQLPEGVQLWAGGAGVLGLERTPRGVLLLPGIAEATAALKKVPLPTDAARMLTT